MGDLPVSLPALRWREVKLDHKAIVVHVLSDVHLAAGRCRLDLLRARLDAIKKAGETHRIICAGDWPDIRTRGSKSAKGGVMTPHQELDLMVGLLKPFADRIDLLIPGNHEDRIEREVDLDFASVAASLIGCVESYRAGATVIRYSLRRCDSVRQGPIYETVSGLVHHGFGGGATPGAALNKLATLVRGWYPEADFACMGHLHQGGVVPIVTYRGFPPHRHTCLLFATGTAVDHEDYAQKFGLAPSWVGAPEVHLGIVNRRETPGSRSPDHYVGVSGWIR